MAGFKGCRPVPPTPEVFIMGLNENRNLMWTKRGKARLILIFSTNTNCENMAYRSFRSEEYSARGVRKVSTGRTGMWQPSVDSDVACGTIVTSSKASGRVRSEHRTLRKERCAPRRNGSLKAKRDNSQTHVPCAHLSFLC